MRCLQNTEVAFAIRLFISSSTLTTFTDPSLWSPFVDMADRIEGRDKTHTKSAQKQGTDLLISSFHFQCGTQTHGLHMCIVYIAVPHRHEAQMLC